MNPIRIPAALSALAAAIPLAHAQQASAQESAATQPIPQVVVSATADNARLDERAATGSHLDITRMQTPASVDVITRAQLEQRGDTILTRAITRAPGLSGLPHPGNGGSSLAARGFTDTVSVMRLVDGMRQYGGVGVTYPFDTWSVERIEVLRGPASVIYGEGAIGGVVNVIPKQPSRRAPESELQAAVGSQGTRRLAAGSGGAIDERWSYRVDASGERSGGWVDMGESSSHALSGALRFDVSPELNLKLSLAQGRQKPMRYFGTPLVDGRQLEALREKNYNVADSTIAYEDTWADLALEWRPNAAVRVRSRLYHVASRRHWRNAESYVWNPATRLVDRADDTEILHDQAQTGNTTDASVKGRLFGLENQVSGGFDLSRSRFTHANNTYVGSPPAVDAFNPIAGLFTSPEPTIPRYRIAARQYALFLEDRLQLDERWSVLGGVRYDHAGLVRTNLVAGVPVYDKTFADTGWRLGTVYQADPALALYAQVARAADPVGALFFLSPASSAFENASGRQFEVGAKRSFWDRHGEWTLAAYDIRKNNLLTRDPQDPARSIQVGRRSSRGIEGSLTLALAAGWTLDANASLLRARFDDFTEQDNGVPVSRAGKLPPDVPRRLANLWLGRDVAPGWNAGAGLRHVGARFADNGDTLRMPSYTVTDLLLRWQAAARTSLALRAFNVFDKRYYDTAYYTPTQWLAGPSRRVELVLDQRF
ncbi:TonB-dependent receptor [Massilia forsythiae]|uniref:TonB-dependent receptor n=1 Tax=Massilia forsythiae TaxID=2728020 RepID=A0A7Z2ZRB9_9BURK|nr:TonB-dependent receptor [Massilia forsythiae]QJD98974.1 TonB-dependent receptor [Massilia forsythiae]